MSDKLKKFINDHKQEFETSEPRHDLWEKIDAGLETGKPQWIKSKRLKYFGFGASILVLTAYIIYYSKKPGLDQQDILAVKNPVIQKERQKENNTETTSNEADGSAEHLVNNNNPQKNVTITAKEKETGQSDSLLIHKRDTLTAKTEGGSEEIGTGTENINPSLVQEKENNRKENKFSVTKNNEESSREVTEADHYNSTLWESASFCSMIRAFKFPGKVSMEGKTKTVGCNDLSNKKNIAAVWVKGRTSKKLTLALEEGFKNIILVKKDGRQINPYAISHYYPGLGVISAYSGKYFNLVFNNKVEMLLFFPEVEEGDKILIDGKVEAEVKKKP